MLGKLDVSEDAPIANEGDEERQQHADEDEDDDVVVGGGAVPQTLLCLGVELVGRPANVVWQVDEEAGQPGRDDGEDGATASEYRVVCVMPADVNVTVDGDQCDGEERYDTADDAEAGCSRAQPRISSHQPLLSHHYTFSITHSSHITAGDCGVVMFSVASVRLSVCNVPTLESCDRESLFLVCNMVS